MGLNKKRGESLYETKGYKKGSHVEIDDGDREFSYWWLKEAE